MISSTFPRIGAVLAAALLLTPSTGLPTGTPRRALQGRLEEARVPGPSLRGNLLREDAVRPALVYLPPSYDEDEDRRFPVVYLLHAFGAGPASWLGADGYEGMNLALTLDSLVDRGEIDEFIVVMPDARTRYGGSWYANSSATGRWTDFIARDLVAWVDRAYRTVPEPWARGLAGQSMGGYGTLRVAMWYPGVFGAAMALSPVNLVSTNPFGIPGMEAALAVTDPDALDLAGPVERVLWAKAAAFAPDPTRPPFYARLPWVREGDHLARDPEIWPLWEASALVNQLDARAAALRELPLVIEVGRNDPLVTEAQGFSEALRAHDVPHALHEFGGGHVRGVRERFEESVFQFFSENLSDSIGAGPGPG